MRKQISCLFLNDRKFGYPLYLEGFCVLGCYSKEKDMKIKGKILPNLKNLYFLKKSPPAWDQKSADHH